MSSVLDLVAKITLDTTEYDKGLETSKSKVSTFGGVVKKGFGTVAGLASKAIAGASAAVTGFGIASVKTGMKFDTSMAQVAATMGKTSAQMESEVASVDLSWGTFTGNLREYAQEMGANTVFSASQAADALNYMALAGYDTEKSMKTLPTVMNLASAGAMDLATASDMVTDTETALGLEAERTTRMIDEMAKTASTTNTSVSQLGSAILTIGGTAKQLRGGFVEMADGTKQAYDGTTELSAALGILADNGVKGSAAGTTLRNMLTSMTGTKWAKTFGDLGVSVYDATGEMRSMKDILADMNKVMDGMTTEEKTSLITKTFNARDLKSINALLATSGQRWDDIITGLNESGEAGVMYAGKLYTMEEAQKQFGDSIYDTEAGFKVLGAAEMMAMQQMDNLSGDMTLFQSALEGAQIAISDKLTPSLREFVQAGSTGLSEFTKKFKSGDVTGAISSLGTAIGNIVTIAVQKLPEAISAGVTLLQGIAQGIARNSGVIFDAARNILTMLYDGIMENTDVAIDTALNFLDSFAGAFANGLPRIAEAATDIITNLASALSDPGVLDNLGQSGLAIIEGIATAVLDNLPRLADAAVEVMRNVGAYLKDNIPGLLETVLQIVEELSGSLRENAGELVDSGLELVQNIAQGIADSIPTLVEHIPAIVENIANIINDNAPKVLNAGINIIKTLAQGIISAIPVIAENLPKIFSAIVAVFKAMQWANIGKQIIASIGKALSFAATTIFPAILSVFAAIGKFLATIDFLGIASTVLSSIGNALLSAGEFLFSAIASLIGTIAGRIGEFLSPVIEAITSTLQGAWETITSVVQVGIMLIQEIINAAIETLLIPWNFIWENFGGVLTDAWEKLKEIVSGALEAISNKISEIWNAIIAFLSPILETIKTIVSNAWENVKSKISGVMDSVHSKVSEIWNTITSFLSEKLEAIKSKFSSIWETIKTTVATVVDAIKSNISDKVEAAKSAVTDKLEAIKTKFHDIFDNIKSHVSGVVDWLKGVFDFHWELPHIKLPHFSISGSFSLNPPSVPHFSIDWYKKAYEMPYLFTDPTIFGGAGFGDGADPGGELVYGKTALMEDIKKAVGGEKVFAPVINVYATAGQDVEELAQKIMDKMEFEYRRAGKAWGAT